MKKVKDIMTQNPQTCRPDASLRDVAKAMVESNCGEIPIVDQNKKPVGVVTDRDIVCRTIALDKNPMDMKAKDVMSSPCVTVDEETSIDECCRTMEEHQVRRIPVVDEDGGCCGIVAQADIAMKTEDEKTSEVVKEVSKSCC